MFSHYLVVLWANLSTVSCIVFGESGDLCKDGWENGRVFLIARCGGGIWDILAKMVWFDSLRSWPWGVFRNTQWLRRVPVMNKSRRLLGQSSVEACLLSGCIDSFCLTQCDFPPTCAYFKADNTSAPPKNRVNHTRCSCALLKDVHAELSGSEDVSCCKFPPENLITKCCRLFSFGISTASGVA